MNNLIELFGNHIYKTAPTNPLSARKKLCFAFSTAGLMCKYFPTKKLLPSRQFMQWAAADSAITPLKTGKNSAIVSLYLPCEILHSMGISTLFPEALACYLAAARSEQIFIDTAEQNFVSQTMCSYHKAFIGMVETGVLPKPDFIINTTLACDANHLSFRRAAEHYNLPQYMIDVPYNYSSGAVDYVAKQIRDMVKAALPMYDISNYNDENIDQAKKDKAALNKAAKALNAKRLEIEKEFMKPFREFKDVVTETVKLIGECSAKIDTVVKQNEQQYKDRKKATIKTYFDGLNVNLVDFNKVFKSEWLNKSASMKSVCNEIDSIFSKVENELSTLKGFGEDFDVLRTYYMDTLNIASTIQYANRLKEQRERAKAAEEARIKAEQEKKAAEEAQMKEEAERAKQNSVNPFARASQLVTNEPPSFVEQTKAQEPELLTRAFTVTTTRENIIALGDFMNDNNIDFDKIELADTLCNTDLNSIVRMLEYSANLIDKTSTKPCEADKARQFRNMIKKIQKKIEQ